MSLAVARIAGQVVPGAEVARAWPAAFVRNVGWRAPALPPRKGTARGRPPSVWNARSWVPSRGRAGGPAR